MLEIDEAQARIMAAFSPLPAEKRALADALGHYLTGDVAAKHDAPPFSNSAMDGYAVRAAEVAGATEETPVTLPVVGESRAGGPMPPPLAVGTTTRILTGAPLPDGADAIVMQEDTTRDGDTLTIRFASPPRHHVRAQGEDIRAGDVLLEDGTRVGPGAIGLLASQGHAEVAVHRRPRVAIVSTGDELRGIDEAPRPGTIVDSNRYALAAQIAEAGGEPVALPPAPDDLDAISELLEEALTCDMVVTTGGVSVGDHDHVREAFERVGIEADFWKIRIKPGKPVTFGRRGNVPVIGLPGNPVSAMVTFQVFARPGIRHMLGDPAPYPLGREVPLGHDHRRKAGRPELARGKLRTTDDGLVVDLYPRQGSGAMPSVARADVLALLPAERDTLTAGEGVLTLPFAPAPGGEVSPFGK
ncbi:MAG: molybdopterin molybdenumtransferase MoeA [Deltaproteobacteria bacterium]|nr:MAG: molybdopterin molybdenumtransferase MoeA [Deltaproteobacteria bacterium]